jgi:uncharacterized membrane protein YfhO
VDGRAAPVLRADRRWMAVPVGAGEHEVELRYKPLSFRMGASVSLLAAVLLLAWIALGGRPKGEAGGDWAGSRAPGASRTLRV